MTTTTRRRSPRKSATPPPRCRALSIRSGRTKDINIVPTWLFMPELERIITQIQTEMLDSSNGQNNEGGLYALCYRLASGNGSQPQRYARRLYDWRKGKTYSVPANMVDRIYGAVGELYTHEDVPIAELPSGPNSAKVMVDTWCEGWSRKDKDALAKKLLHFSEGICLGWDVIEIQVCNALERFFRANR